MAKDILQAPFSCLGQGLYASVFQDIKEGKKKKSGYLGELSEGIISMVLFVCFVASRVDT